MALARASRRGGEAGGDFRGGGGAGVAGAEGDDFSDAVAAGTLLSGGEVFGGSLAAGVSVADERGGRGARLLPRRPRPRPGRSGFAVVLAGGLGGGAA